MNKLNRSVRPRRMDESSVDTILHDIGVALEESVDYDTRTIYVTGEIAEEALFDYTIPILKINEEDNLDDIPVDERLPITMYIDCVGGAVDIGMNLVDIMQTSKTPIKTIVLSKAYSMGSILAMAGHNRLCYRHSKFLIHDGMMGLPPMKTSQVIDTYKHFLKITEEVDKFILANSKISPKQYKKNKDKEWYLNSEEALKLGLIDEIIR